MPTEAALQRDLQDAMRARDRVRIDVLRGLITAVKNTKVDKQVPELPEAEIVALVRKEANKRVEIIDFARQANRAETVAQAETEKAILDAYLPAQMDAAQLEAAIRAIAAELGGTQIGPLMAELRKRHAGQFDGKLASELIKKL
ncbi:MAG: GatB/YqeY domain-containing protein [Deltaproteobacteria bacterium]|nr:GatB/YqeY domain-containing protein [Deltaproteobacteria bacterium]